MEVNMELAEFASSSNGDRWFLEKNGADGKDYVLHRANKGSGGHETRYEIERFLALRPQGPEHAALRMLIEDRQPSRGTA
jgi:hypothetical protein